MNRVRTGLLIGALTVSACGSNNETQSVSGGVTTNSVQEATDYYPAGGTEAEYYNDPLALRDASDIAVEAVVSEVRLSKYTFEGIDEPFAVAEIVLKVSETYRESGAGPSVSEDGHLSVYWSLNGVSTADQDLKDFTAVLPTTTSWWFLRSRPGLDGGYRVINTAAILESSPDGSVQPSLYRGTADAVRRGAPVEGSDHESLISSVGEMNSEDLRAVLRR